jgi:activator of 2-hydroxyglutaryl-CoA dehydratase
MGIEIGSLYLKCVEIDERGATVWHLVERHRGNIEPLLAQCRDRARSRDLPLALVSHGTAPAGIVALDAALCLTVGARASCPDARNILEVGGSTLTLVRVDELGRIVSVHCNSLCAAGSGSFLDEQASRLNIDRDRAGQPSTR